MGILGDTTTVWAQTGRKLNNALTLTFKTSAETTLATAVQAGSFGVLLGFRNGGRGRYKIQGSGVELVVECAADRTRVTSGDGHVVGSIENDASGEGVLQSADGALLARVTGQPKERRHDPAWHHEVTDAEARRLGLLIWIRTTGTFDLAGALTDLYVWWDRPGESLKVPSLGTHLVLDHPVSEVLGDLLLAMCIDVAVGSHSFLHS